MNEPIYVIGYARVSTPKQAQEGESLEDQERSIKKHCEKMGWTLFPPNKVYQEPFTGTKTNRPVYNEILEMLKINKKAINIKYFVFWDFDRLTRAGTIDYDQIWKDVKNFDVKLRDTTEIIQDEKNAFEEFGFTFEYDWAVARPSEDTERQKVEDARKERIKILQRLIKPEIYRTQDGYQIGNPDYGFQNKQILVGTKKKIIQVRYEPEAIFVERIYKLRAEGILTDQEICDDVNALGYKSRLKNRWSKDRKRIVGTFGGKKLDVKQMQDLVKRFTYCGVLCEKWTKFEPIKAQYDGLVLIDEWNKANRGKVHLEVDPDGSITLLENVGVHGKKRPKYNPEFPFKNILVCEDCGKPMKASAPKNKSKNPYPYYHCSRGHITNSIPKKTLEDTFNTYLENIKFTDKFLNIFNKTVYLQFKKREGELAEDTSKANINVGELEAQKSALIKSFPTATIQVVRENIEQEIEKLQSEIIRAKAHRDKMEIEETDLENFSAWCKEIMEHPAKILEDIRSQQEQEATFSLFFDRFPTYTEIVSGTPKLSLVFKLSEEFKVNQDLAVTPRRVELRLPA